MKQVCSVCGCDNVQVKAWVDINSKRFTEFLQKKYQKAWCPDCCNEVKIENELDFHNKKK